jgi:hypothetical protein
MAEVRAIADIAADSFPQKNFCDRFSRRGQAENGQAQNVARSRE